MRYDPPPLPTSIPELLRDVVVKALRRDPSHRYASAESMRKELREAERMLWLKEREEREGIRIPAKDHRDSKAAPQLQATTMPHRRNVVTPTIPARIER